MEQKGPVLCDSCRKKLPSGTVRYVLKMELYAAPEFTVGEEDYRGNIRQKIEELTEQTKDMSEQELLEQVYIAYKLTLCQRCRDIFVKRVAHREFV